MLLDTPFRKMIWNSHQHLRRREFYFDAVPVSRGEGTMQHDPERAISLQSMFINIYNVIYTHLTTPTIRSQIQWLRMSYIGKSYRWDKRVILWESVLKYKFSRDTFCFHNGKQATLSVLTCTSIPGGAASMLTSDPIGIYDGAETVHSLSLMSQKHDIQIYMLRSLGIADPHCGEIIGVQMENVEDTGGLVKSIGRDSATSTTRFCFSQHNLHVHVTKWKKYQVLIL